LGLAAKGHMTYAAAGARKPGNALLIPTSRRNRPDAQPEPVAEPRSGGIAKPALDPDRHSDIADALRQSVLVYGSLLHYAMDRGALTGEKVEAFSGPLLGVQGLGYREGSQITIVFRGSNELQDWLINVLVLPIGLPLRHLGFQIAWWRVRAQVRNWLSDALQPGDTIRLCGHSLGGAVAKLAAFDLSSDYPVHRVVTFGAPRFAFLGTADRFNSRRVPGLDQTLGEVTDVVVNNRDLVSKVPFWPYREVGQLIWVDELGRIATGEPAANARGRQRSADLALATRTQADIFDLSGNYGLKPRNEILDTLRIFAESIRPVFLPLFLYMQILLQLGKAGSDHLSGLYGNAFLPGEIEEIRQRAAFWKSGGQKAWEVISNGILLLAGGAPALWLAWILLKLPFDQAP
jgi:pimeloyl-ACP methyl ester carboxylesterase